MKLRLVPAIVVIALALHASSALAVTPSISNPSISGTPGANGWYVSTVTVAFDITLSSFTETHCGTISTTSTGLHGVFTLVEGVGQKVKCSVLSADGDAATPEYTFNVDTTAPTIASAATARGPDSNSWFNHALSFAVTGTDGTSGIASCSAPGYSGPDSGSASVNATCTDTAGNVSAPRSITFQYDGTGPSVSASAARAPDANGWYNHAVGVSFTGSDSTSGIDSCTSGSYSGPDNGSAGVSGTCKDKAGNSASASFALKYDATPPTVSGAAPNRSPDANGWYNHELAVAFNGTDATSGLASCDTVTYTKPTDATASVTGRCTDNAGNASAATPYAFKFDSTPPKVSDLGVSAIDNAVTLSWKASSDVATVKVTRAGGGKPLTVYNGKRVTTFTDKKVKDGVHYSYLLTALDAAGNAATLKGLAAPAAELLAPRSEAKVKGGGTMLRWKADKKASYYNVQVWLGRKKVLTTWPTTASLPLTGLRPGRYMWLVWPGLGDRTKHRYGTLIGKSTFTVTG